MKKIITIITVLLILMNTAQIVHADTPLTSTYFSKAYYDIEIVEKASRHKYITADMAQYLADESNPIDVKAALINALSWDIDGKNNTERYCQFIYGKSLKDIDVAELSGHQQFCIGYLLAMDDIDFNSKESLEIMRMAKNSMPDSLTVAVITFIIETMCGEVSGDWQESYKTILADPALNGDMPDEAIQHISNYILYGIDSPVNIPKTGEKGYGLFYGLAAVAFFAAGAVIRDVNVTSIAKKR